MGFSKDTFLRESETDPSAASKDISAQRCLTDGAGRKFVSRASKDYSEVCAWMFAEVSAAKQILDLQAGREVQRVNMDLSSDQSMCGWLASSESNRLTSSERNFA